MDTRTCVLTAGITATVCAALCASCVRPDHSVRPEVGPGWGRPADGVQCRLEDLESASVENITFARAEDIAFRLIIKKVGNKLVKLVEPGSARGSSVAPLLFQIDFFRLDGTRVDLLIGYPVWPRDVCSLQHRTVWRRRRPVAYEIRPDAWAGGPNLNLKPGTYRARVTYLGGTQAQKVCPDDPVATSWSGKVESNLVTFTIAGDPDDKGPHLVWGEPVRGLRAAVEFVPDQETYSPPCQMHVRLHIQNVSDRIIQFASKVPRNDYPIVTDANGTT